MSSSSSRQLEIEVKFLLQDLQEFRQQMIKAGAQPTIPRTYEKNIRFDTPDQDLASQGKLLRLRQDKIVRLTFKGEPENALDSEARIREELEVTASDFDMLAAILTEVGFKHVQVYEKFRETFRMGLVEVVIDQMPYGDFVELEGEELDIKKAAKQLGLDWNERILANYLALMAKLKDLYRLDFDDLTFDNFSHLNISMAKAIETNPSIILEDYWEL